MTLSCIISLIYYMILIHLVFVEDSSIYITFVPQFSSVK